MSGLRKQYRAGPRSTASTLQIGRGEVFALLGPNGAGKTTTSRYSRAAGTGTRARSACSAPTRPPPAGPGGRGSASFRRGPARRRAHRPGTGYALQLVFPRPSQPDEVIAAVGLSGRPATRLRRLSGGQRRRADVAVGIVGRPELLFLDEPTTGFDPQARRQFWDLIAGLAADGTTVLLTTHYLDEAAALAGQLAVIAGGRIVATGTPADLGAGILA